tara:strand:- start:746 stop:952 length:207 start_codon:yes stop_codon:yes gene_type:complete
MNTFNNKISTNLILMFKNINKDQGLKNGLMYQFVVLGTFGYIYNKNNQNNIKYNYNDPQYIKYGRFWL